MKKIKNIILIILLSLIMINTSKSENIGMKLENIYVKFIETIEKQENSSQILLQNKNKKCSIQKIKRDFKNCIEYNISYEIFEFMLPSSIQKNNELIIILSEEVASVCNIRTFVLNANNCN